jgi:hypothetical protein
LVIGDAETVLLLTAATFAVSALVVRGIPLDRDQQRPEPLADAQPRSRSLLKSARDGLAATLALPEARALVLSSSAIVLALGMLNVGELLLAREELRAGNTGLAALVTAFGAGVVGGAVWSSRPAEDAQLGHRYVLGLALVAAGLLAAGLAPALPVACAAFAVVGAGQGVAVVHERRLLAAIVPPHLLGRVFGVERSLVTTAFGLSYGLAAGLLVVMDARSLFLISGVAAVAAALAAAMSLLRVAPAAPAAVRG